MCIRQTGCKCRHEALHMPKCFVWHFAVLAVSVTMRRQLMRTCRCQDIKSNTSSNYVPWPQKLRIAPEDARWAAL